MSPSFWAQLTSRENPTCPRHSLSGRSCPPGGGSGKARAVPHQACQVLTKSWALETATGTRCRASREPLGSKGHRERPHSAEGRTCWTPGPVPHPETPAAPPQLPTLGGMLPSLVAPGAPLVAATLATLDVLVLIRGSKCHACIIDYPRVKF